MVRCGFCSKDLADVISGDLFHIVKGLINTIKSPGLQSKYGLVGIQAHGKCMKNQHGQSGSMNNIEWRFITSGFNLNQRFPGIFFFIPIQQFTQFFNQLVLRTKQLWAAGVSIFSSIIFITLIAIKECPPSSKKLSWMPTCCTCNASLHIAASMCWVSVSGSLIFLLPNSGKRSGSGNEFLSSLPFALSGNAVQRNKNPWNHIGREFQLQERCQFIFAENT